MSGEKIAKGMIISACRQLHFADKRLSSEDAKYGLSIELRRPVEQPVEFCRRDPERRNRRQVAMGVGAQVSSRMQTASDAKDPSPSLLKQ
jgi:hypothetical protein